MEAFYGILIPFLGTSLGAACVFFLRKTLSDAAHLISRLAATASPHRGSHWSAQFPSLPWKGRWLGEAETERSWQI